MTRSTVATLGGPHPHRRLACNDQSGLGYTGRLQFTRCMTPRGYAVRSGD